MDKLTKEINGKYLLIDEANLELAVEKLGRYENLYEVITKQQEDITKQLETLKNEGKEKTARFRELLGNKMMNNHIMGLIKIYVETKDFTK